MKLEKFARLTFFIAQSNLEDKNTWSIVTIHSFLFLHIYVGGKQFCLYAKLKHILGERIYNQISEQKCQLRRELNTSSFISYFVSSVFSISSHKRDRTRPSELNIIALLSVRTQSLLVYYQWSQGLLSLGNLEIFY